MLHIRLFLSNEGGNIHIFWCMRKRCVHVCRNRANFENTWWFKCIFFKFKSSKLVIFLQETKFRLWLIHYSHAVAKLTYIFRCISFNNPCLQYILWILCVDMSSQNLSQLSPVTKYCSLTLAASSTTVNFFYLLPPVSVLFSCRLPHSSHMITLPFVESS